MPKSSQSLQWQIDHPTAPSNSLATHLWPTKPWLPPASSQSQQSPTTYHSCSHSNPSWLERPPVAAGLAWKHGFEFQVGKAPCSRHGTISSSCCSNTESPGGDCTSCRKCMLNWRPVMAKTESDGGVGSYYRDYIPSTKASCLAWTRIPVGNTRRQGEATLPWRPCRQIFSGCSGLKGFGWGREV